jgi:hypothetical protein
MATQRLGRKQGTPGILFALAAFEGLSLLLGPSSSRATTTEYIVTDRYSGLAISGFDPVAYFTDHAPRLGKGEFEYRYAGVVWRFHNEGNRAAFAADPEVYAPRFGGYDAIDVARGAAVPGNPLLWTVKKKRLYLFYTRANQLAFARNADRVIAAATKHWPSVQLTLSP